MRLRNVKGSKEIIESSKYIVLNPEENKGKWKNVFGNDKPIHIEIGMGKGDFIIGMAKNNPNINIVAHIIISADIVDFLFLNKFLIPSPIK